MAIDVHLEPLSVKRMRDIEIKVETSTQVNHMETILMDAVTDTDEEPVLMDAARDIEPVVRAADGNESDEGTTASKEDRQKDLSDRVDSNTGDTQGAVISPFISTTDFS